MTCTRNCSVDSVPHLDVCLDNSGTNSIETVNVRDIIQHNITQHTVIPNPHSHNQPTSSSQPHTTLHTMTIVFITWKKT
jgi:hypothetical protein